MFNWRKFVADAIFECHARLQRNFEALYSYEALQRFIEALINLTRPWSHHMKPNVDHWHLAV